MKKRIILLSSAIEYKIQMNDSYPVKSSLCVIVIKKSLTQLIKIAQLFLTHNNIKKHEICFKINLIIIHIQIQAETIVKRYI